MEYEVTKGTVELYKFRHKSGCYWADITIDAQGTTGRISISSDYGNWSNYWGACGCPFKEFLGQIGFDYAASKFNAEQWIDTERSLQGFKELVISYRRDESIDEFKAREVWDEIEGLKGESHSLLAEAITHSEHLYGFLLRYGGGMGFSYEPNPHFKQFWETIWPALLAEFAKEKEAIDALAIALP